MFSLIFYGRVLVLGALFCAISCGGSGSGLGPTAPPIPSGPGSCGASAAAGSISASVDGQAYQTSSILLVNFIQGTFNLQGIACTNTNIQILALGAEPTGVGTFKLGGAYVTGAFGGGVTWDTNEAGGSGTITFTRLSSTSAAGTFSFVAPPDRATGASGTKTVTNGRFDVTF